MKTVKGTTVADKANGAVTIPNGGVIESTTAFSAIRIRSNTSGKSVAVTSATIVVE